MTIDLTSLRIPEAYQEPVDYFLCALIVWALTDTVLDIAWVRHRWRHMVLASKTLGLICTTLIMIWPSRIAGYGLCLCLFNGFSDPRLHLASIKRNPAHPVAKWWFCLTLLAHHAGGAFLVMDMIRPVVLGNKQAADMELPVYLACLAEIFAWYTDLKVLTRTAPRWVGPAHQLAVLVQLVCCLSLLVLSDPREIGLCPTVIVGTMVGSASWLLAGFIGFTNSTHEIETEIDPKASIARLFHREQPLTQDTAILPFVVKRSADK